MEGGSSSRFWSFVDGAGRAGRGSDGPWAAPPAPRSPARWRVWAMAPSSRPDSPTAPVWLGDGVGIAPLRRTMVGDVDAPRGGGEPPDNIRRPSHTIRTGHLALLGSGRILVAPPDHRRKIRSGRITGHSVQNRAAPKRKLYCGRDDLWRCPRLARLVELFASARAAAELLRETRRLPMPRSRRPNRISYIYYDAARGTAPSGGAASPNSRWIGIVVECSCASTGRSATVAHFAASCASAAVCPTWCGYAHERGGAWPPGERGPGGACSLGAGPPLMPVSSSRSRPPRVLSWRCCHEAHGNAAARRLRVPPRRERRGSNRVTICQPYYDP